jgi:uncharacterized protein
MKIFMKHKLKKKLSYVLIILLFLLSIAFLCITVIKSKEKDRACFDETCFKIEMAQDPVIRTKGLMYREKLDLDRGMLFIFEQEDIYAFWMKNTYIHLDMIWIDKEFVVVDIYKNATPCRETCDPIIPSANATYVLEINSGLADKYNIKVGDRVKIFGME